MVRLRQARAGDVVAVTKYALPPFVGIVCEEDGVTIGTGLILVIQRRPMVTFDMSERMRQMPRIMIRIGFNLVVAGLEAFDELYVVQDSSRAGSGKWLSRLGFAPTEETMSGEKVWKRSR